MRTNCGITLFHFDENEQKFVSSYFPKAYAYFKESISKSGIKQKGFYLSNNCIVRIPLKKEIKVMLGDYVAMGKISRDNPEPGEDLKVVEICNNKNCRSPHIRLSCGG